VFRPLNDSVVVEPLKAKDTGPGGLLLSDDVKEKYHGLRAAVVAVGPGELTIQGTRVPIDLKPGDVVVLKSAGPLIDEGGRRFCVVSVRDIAVVVEGSETPVRHFSPQEFSTVGAG
jgi:chaperonin GroES